MTNSGPGTGPASPIAPDRIDRLARSTFDLFAMVKRIVDAKAQFRSLAEPWADTGTERLMLAVTLLHGSGVRAH